MTTGNADHSQGERGGGGGKDLPPSPAPPSPGLSAGNNVYKSGPLYLSSKGIGWTSWKKRWFILTQTSLVFFRSDPNAPTHKGSEVNLTLGGIDLNSSGSVVVKEDKKLLTVLFPDGRDGRAFTLKAETMDDLHEWKVALDEALLNAPAAVAIGQNGILKKDQCNAIDLSSDQCLLKDRPVKSLVIGGPILLALEDIDGTPSFLEKGLRFVEEHGVKVEGILRQAADVDDVEYRIREYEKGKNEFSPQEDPHVIADCVKYVLRELPSSPVPASCCKALLEAFRTDRGTRVNSMRTAICETFPEPNRRLLQRILMMMQTVASHKAVNRMSTSAVAACMAPLLLRPLLAGDCELENDFDVGGDGSIQLLQAAAAANHAQAIVITLLDEYENIFGEGSATPEPYTDSEESETESGEEITDDDDDSSFDDDGDEEEATEESDVDADADEHLEQLPTATSSGTDEYEYKVPRSQNSGSESPAVDDVSKGTNSLPSSPLQTSLFQHVSVQGSHDIPNQFSDDAKKEKNDWSELLGAKKSSSGPLRGPRRPTTWGRTPAKRNLSMESIDLPSDDEAEIEKLESVKIDLQDRIATEAKMNSLLVDGLQKRKHDLQERRLALTKDVARLQEQLQKEMELRTALEAAERTSQIPQFVSSIIDEKVKADLEEIAQTESDVFNLKQKADDLAQQLNRQRDQNSRFGQSSNLQKKSKEKQIDGGAISISSTPETMPRSKYESYFEKPDSGKGKKQETLTSSNKQPTPNQQTDDLHSSKAIEGFTLESAVEIPTNKNGNTGSRKSSARGEGTNATGSALSKLTNRLNFLKERRSQIASELQNLDKNRNSSQPVQNLEQQKTGGSQQLQDPKGEKTGQSENYESLHNNPDGPRSPNLDRGKSESFPVVDKSRSKNPPRTYSR